jgi:hypothetical protein
MDDGQAFLPFPDEPEAGLTIGERFRRFHAGNPEVFRLFRKFAAQAKKAGLDRYSADAILHRVRWECDVAGAWEGGFKINNSFSAYYARELMAEYPEYVGFFELRRLRTRVK